MLARRAGRRPRRTVVEREEDRERRVWKWSRSGMHVAEGLVYGMQRGMATERNKQASNIN